MSGPSRREDARSLAAIMGGAFIGLVATATLVMPFRTHSPELVRHEAIRVRVEAPPPPPTVKRIVIPPPPARFGAADRIYGRVLTRAGQTYEGFLRWDRNEASWADVLDATKAGHSAGLRFGNIRFIEPAGSSAARVTLRSGGVVELTDDATDLGTRLRGLEVSAPGTGSTTLKWAQIERVELEAAPDDLRPREGRLHGTLRTVDGSFFTGYISWAVEDVYTSDVLETGTAAGDIPYHAVASIHRDGSRGARVVLREGPPLELQGGPDIGPASPGMTVSDPGLGEIKLPWREFESVRFHPPAEATSRARFEGGGTIRGTVTTDDGDQHTGLVVWDRDEAGSWEMLDGSSNGVSFQVEFAAIRSIVKTPYGARVALRDGRTLRLSASNDVSAANRGVMVGGDGRLVDVPWSEFRELRLDGGGR